MTVRTLVVDDSAFQRTIIAEALDDRFDVVAEATDGREAIDAYEQHAPDLVTMDIQMPELDGVEATARIKHDDSDVPVVMCTSVDQREKMREAVRAGADGYVTKPFDETELVTELWAAAGED